MKPKQTDYRIVRTYLIENKKIGAVFRSETIRQLILEEEDKDISSGAISTIFRRLEKEGYLSHDRPFWTLISKKIISRNQWSGKEEPPKSAPEWVVQLSEFFAACTQFPVSYPPIRLISQEGESHIWQHTILKIWKASRDSLASRNTTIVSSLAASCALTTLNRFPID